MHVVSISHLVSVYWGNINTEHLDVKIIRSADHLANYTPEIDALPGRNLSRLGKRKIMFKSGLGRGYVSSKQGIYQYLKGSNFIQMYVYISLAIEHVFFQ